MPEQPLHPTQMDEQTIADCHKLVELALVEDVHDTDLEKAWDCTTLSVVPDDIDAAATFVSRDEGVVCGLQVAQLAIKRFAPKLKLELLVSDSQPVAPKQALAVLSGEARKILMMERTCLNFMCRLSGISTLTNRFVQLANAAKTPKDSKAKILDTRKTTPGWRRLEKYAVACGGGENHRMGLYDAVMIKDNHLAMYGAHIDNHDLSVTQAIEMTRAWVVENKQRLPHGEKTIVQIEVDTLEQLELALSATPDIVLLDNMDTQQLSKAVAMRDAANQQVRLEASGGVNLSTIVGIASTGVDRISIGALTHSAVNFDIGLDWRFGSQ